MAIFSFHFDKKVPLIFITSLVWGFNFRTTFNNINYHMGIGSYASLKYDPLLYLIKNIICIFYVIGFFLEIKNNKFQGVNKEVIIQKKEGNKIIISHVPAEENDNNQDILKDFEKSQNLNNLAKKILFFLKVFSMILFISVVEDAYFIIANNHIIDRVICPIRNFGMLLSLSILSLVLMNKKIYRNKHQLIPLIVTFIVSFSIIIFNYSDIDRFKKKFGALNTAIDIILFVFMGIEMIVIKILTENQYLSIYLILGLKGIMGTIIFAIIYGEIPQEEFFNFFDKTWNFEYEFLNESFPIIYKILYIISLVFLAFLKIYTINQFSENHILSSIMIIDIIYFPLYCVERFAIQGFGISTPSCFWLNLTAGIISCFLMLIFNEILECNFWGLNLNLKKNIDLRQNMDYSKNKNSKEKISFNKEYKLDAEDEDFTSDTYTPTTSLNGSQLQNL